MNKRDEIKDYRKEIDRIHQELISLIAKRNNICNKIHKLKNELKLSKVDIVREKEIIENAREIAKNLKINERVVMKIMKLLIRNNLERK